MDGLCSIYIIIYSTFNLKTSENDIKITDDKRELGTERTTMAKHKQDKPCLTWTLTNFKLQVKHVK